MLTTGYGRGPGEPRLNPVTDGLKSVTEHNHWWRQIELTTISHSQTSSQTEKALHGWKKKTSSENSTCLNGQIRMRHISEICLPIYHYRGHIQQNEFLGCAILSDLGLPLGMALNFSTLGRGNNPLLCFRLLRKKHCHNLFQCSLA
jgi:hypothetical protein